MSFEASPAAFEAVAVNVNVPDSVGVPESVPLVLSVSPAGSVPPDLVQVMGFVPEAVRVIESHRLTR